MEAIGQSAEPGGETVREPSVYWLTRVLPRGMGRSVLGAALFATALYVGGYLVARYTGETGYLEDEYFYLFALGAFFELLLLANWSARYPKLWKSLDTPTEAPHTRTFDVPSKRYDEVVDRGLRRLYRLDVPVVLFVCYHLFVYRFMFEEGGFDALRLANLTVVNLFGVFIVYLALCHVLLLKDVAALPVSNVDVAADRLEEVINFGLVVIVEWFLGLTVLSLYVFGLVALVHAQDLNIEQLLTAFPAEFPDINGGELALLVGLLAVGVLAFFSTLLLVHTALAAAKRRELRAIRREYDRFYDLWEDEAESKDRLSVGLEILERRTESANAARTWPYNAAMLLRLGVASQLPVLSFVASVVLGG